MTRSETPASNSFPSPISAPQHPSPLRGVAAQITQDFAARCDNSSVYRLDWETIAPNRSHPADWVYMGDASDARTAVLLEQPGYIQVSTTRIDHVIQLIARPNR